MTNGYDLPPEIDASPEDILVYIHEMLYALAELAAAQGDTALAAEIRRAEATPKRVSHRH